MAMEVNLEKPLCQELEMKHTKKCVEYENLPWICSYCGRAGHLVSICPFNPQKPTDPIVPPAAGSSDKIGENKHQSSGEWMTIPTRGRRGPVITDSPTDKASTSGQTCGSRFDFRVDLSGDNSKGQGGVEQRQGRMMVTFCRRPLLNPRHS
ncbi:OLC1v1018578C1 [Oldenlandia corymbosa var. corymbosa]|uniref:OLC1v1018578C1 n=1 Tax=Oldenlandia corymbosa var. corymbosa TaxID=529605 RepID=A0AAV1EC17_OLDCO|nr:OLC1v1018578C1 [Oldenlandia corymbosa var. corymbosa]